MNQSHCPSPDALANLLAATLPADQETLVSRHIEHCTDCQHQLDSLSDDKELQSFSRFRHAATLRETVPAWLLARLLGSQPVTSDAIEALTFLKPAQQDGDLGTLGQYRVMSLLGQGGMGVVLLAYDTVLHRHVALKVLWPPPGNSAARERIIREAQAVAQVRNEHVVDVFAVHHDAGDPPYLVMEYVPGKTLRDNLKDGNFALPQIVNWMIEVSQGLTAAHAVGLIHRDVKPSNILIDDATSQAKLTDFGLARISVIDAEKSSQAFLAGTPAFMSPEQFLQHGKVDERSDVYSLGATLYEALTGAPPFRGPADGLLLQVMQQEPVAPRRLNLAIPVDLDTICLKCLAKEPARRYATAQLLADDLQRYLDGKPILARPLSFASRLARIVRRHPIPSTLAALLILSLIAGTLISLYQWNRAESNLKLAHEKMDAAYRTIDQFCIRVSEDRLLNEPGMQPLRRELLNIAVPELQKLSLDKPTDPQLYDKWIKTTYLLAKLRKEMEGPAVAIPILYQVIPVLKERYQQHPDHDANRRLLVDVLMYEGICRENLRQYSQANTIWKEIEGLLKGREEPPDRLLQSRLYINMGKTAADQRDMKNGSAFAQRAHDIADQLTITNPEIVEGHYCLATSTGNWASSLASQQKYPQAEKIFREAIDHWKKIIDDHPKNHLSQMEMLRNQLSLADLFLMTSRFADARKELDAGLPVIERLIKRYPQSLALKKFHGQFLINAGMCSQMTGEQQVAEKYYQRAVDALAIYHQDDPEDFPIHYDLIRARLVQAYLWQDMFQLEKATTSMQQLPALLQDYAAQVPQAALEMKQHGHTVSYTLAMILAEQGKLLEAINIVKEIANSEPWSPSFQQMVEGLLEEQATGKDLSSKLLSHYQPFLQDCKQAEAAAPQTAGMYYLAALCAGRSLKLVQMDPSLTSDKRTELDREFKSAILRWLAIAKRSGYFQTPERKKSLQQNALWQPLQGTEVWRQLNK